MHKLSALLLLLFWFSVDTASAQSLRFVTDNAAPIELKAGDMVWQRETGHAVLSDAARFAQGPLSLSAARIDLSFAPDGTAQTMTHRPADVSPRRSRNALSLRFCQTNPKPRGTHELSALWL